MGWWGTLVGGAFGYLLGGPLGAIFGAAVGSKLDRGMADLGKGGFEPGAQQRVQAAFFTATFSVMGHIAKADGRVSDDEIEYARAVMAHMELDSKQKKLATNLFNQGKAPDFPLHSVIEQFRRECHRRSTLLRMFIELQIQGAYADGELHPREKRVLLDICAQLGIPRAEFDHLEAMARAARGGPRGGTGRAQRAGGSLSEAYAILGVARTAGDAEVKKAYRRLMSQHHPDKLVAKGLPEEMMKAASEKTHEIRTAYEKIMESRGS